MRLTIEQVLADSPEVLEALRHYRELLQGTFGARLERVSLFGSRARREEREGSDVDALVLIRGLTQLEHREAAALAGDVAADTGVWLSPSVHASEAFRSQVLSGLLEREMSRRLASLQAFREASDYQIGFVLELETARLAVADAEAFVARCDQVLESSRSET